MKIKYLGTAAYEGVPALFCRCDVCKRAWARGGKNLRSRSQAIVNDEILMDFNADTVWHSQKYRIDWEKICACLITHSHCDHLYPDDVGNAEHGFSYDHRAINFYADNAAYRMLQPFVEKTKGGATLTPARSGERFFLADGKYSVLPLRANHDPAADPLIYSITGEGKRLLYAHDTGVFTDEAWKGMKEEGRYDLVSFDCTGCLGLKGGWRDGHMCVRTNLEMMERMKQEGLIDGKTVIVISHFSHNGGQIHDELVEEVAKYGIVVAYDGLELEF